MEDFAIFEKIQEYENKQNKEKSKQQLNKGKECESKQGCSHKNIITEDELVSCIDCGEQLKKNIMHEKEWRYYGNGDTKHSSDPNRVQMRKCDERNIFKDVENMNFPDKIVSKADKLYQEVTDGQIKRGNSRKAIVFACIFIAYKINENPQIHDKLIKIFGLNRKSALQGLKHVTLNSKKSSDIHKTHITPVHLVKNIMDKFQGTDEQKEEVIKLYGKIKNKNSKLNRARPQSIASGLTYYWICLNKKNISLKDFSKRVDLSELTISKISKLIAEILKTPNVV